MEVGQGGDGFEEEVGVGVAEGGGVEDGGEEDGVFLEVGGGEGEDSGEDSGEEVGEVCSGESEGFGKRMVFLWKKSRWVKRPSKGWVAE